MGLGGISIWQLLIILVIVLLLFGTSKLRNIGGDLGGAIKSFKKSMKEGEDEEEEEGKEDDEEAAEASASIEDKGTSHKEASEKKTGEGARSGNGAAKRKQS